MMNRARQLKTIGVGGVGLAHGGPSPTLQVHTCSPTVIYINPHSFVMAIPDILWVLLL